MEKYKVEEYNGYKYSDLEFIIKQLEDLFNILKTIKTTPKHLEHLLLLTEKVLNFKNESKISLKSDMEKKAYDLFFLEEFRENLNNKKLNRVKIHYSKASNDEFAKLSNSNVKLINAIMKLQGCAKGEFYTDLKPFNIKYLLSFQFRLRKL